MNIIIHILLLRIFILSAAEFHTRYIHDVKRDDHNFTSLIANMKYTKSTRPSSPLNTCIKKAQNLTISWSKKIMEDLSYKGGKIQNFVTSNSGHGILKDKVHVLEFGDSISRHMVFDMCSVPFGSSTNGSIRNDWNGELKYVYKEPVAGTCSVAIGDLSYIHIYGNHELHYSSVVAT